MLKSISFVNFHDSDFYCNETKSLLLYLNMFFFNVPHEFFTENYLLAVLYIVKYSNCPFGAI